MNTGMSCVKGSRAVDRALIAVIIFQLKPSGNQAGDGEIRGEVPGN